MQKLFQSIVGACLLCLLTLIFAACSASETQASIKASNTTVNNMESTTSITSRVALNATKLDISSCPSTVSNPSYWDPIVGTQPGVNAVQSVTCANLEGDASLQALVTVGYEASGTIDAYVYTDITASQPQEIFSLQGLSQGSASISANNTIITSEVDNGATVSHEYAWSASVGTFVQIS